MESIIVGIKRNLDMAEKKKINEFQGMRIETIQKGNTERENTHTHTQERELESDGLTSDSSIYG